MKPYQIATAAVMILIAAVAMFDSRASALPDASGKFPGGLGPGFYPFWSAALIAGAAAVVIYRWYLTTDTGEGVFAKRESWIAPLKIALPMVVAVAFIQWLGFYFVTGLYMAFFARFIGRYRWVWVVVIAVIFPAVIYFAFEKGFRVTLPKSKLYEQGFPL
ncbi:MAG: tripartite tricarboxylate transporter TctB family protein [Chloroflexota bacterium]